MENWKQEDDNPFYFDSAVKDEILKKMEILEIKLNNVIDIYNKTKNKLENNPEEYQVFFYNPCYKCVKDFVQILKNTKLKLHVTLLNIIGNEIKLYIIGVNENFLNDKIKTMCYDSDGKFYISCFIKSKIEENCYYLKDFEFYQKMKFPLYFSLNVK